MDDEDLSLLRRKQPQFIRRHSGYPFGSRECRKLDLQLITLPFEQRLLCFQALNGISQPHDINPLPDEDKYETHARDDGNRFHACPSLPIRWMTRSLALRDLGLRSVSSSDGTCGRFVKISSSLPLRAESALKVCFTMRSSREWNEMTHRRAPGANTSAASRSDASKCSSS